MTNTENMKNRAAEAARFFSHVVKDSDPSGCWIWTGAISDDGYGRFWIKRDGKQQAVRPHRYAFMLVHGQAALEDAPVLMHVCDVPLCVKATYGEDSHLWAGTQRDNLIDRARKRGAVNQHSGWRGLTRAEKAARSRRLRESIKNGTPVRDAVCAFVTDLVPGQMSLF